MLLNSACFHSKKCIRIKNDPEAIMSDEALRQLFYVNFRGETICADSISGSKGHVLMIHGGSRDRKVFSNYRRLMHSLGYGTTAFDCLGHGETSGRMSESSLCSRTLQAEAVIAHLQQPLTGCMGISMGAYNALHLSRKIPLRSLILMVPGVYTASAYDVNFGPQFSGLIRKERSWESTDAWAIAAEFTGKLLVIAAEKDDIIPEEIPLKLISSAPKQAWKHLLLVPGADHNSIWHNLTLSARSYEQARGLFERCLSAQEKYNNEA
ncbi:alpha/beta hydrolase [Cedecea colo]|uniref:Alpha/beta hydrolase n=1 Tax=Cedecea colo TaxID=2552946 RepID=A0ABX0VRL6_9ENTR|nr:alpha/beta hydrolase [Cedecea colo]NIY49230.1 alpha/beta hydrolase [Cedecea colo]